MRKLFFCFWHITNWEVIQSLETYFLVLWENDQAVSVVERKKIISPDKPNAGNICEVKQGKQVYTGRLAATGISLVILINVVLL